MVTPEEFDIILNYLAKFHGRDARGSDARRRAGQRRGGRGPRANVGAADRHRVDAAAAARGQKIYAAECVTCHGSSARGTERGANLIRSPLVLRDRYGSAIGPFLKKGHPMQTGAAERQPDRRADHRPLALHLAADQRHAAGIAGVRRQGHPHRRRRRPGEAYFAGEGRCATCHSPTGDLAGYGTRYSPVDIQQRFVFPVGRRGRGRGGARRSRSTVTVTPPNGAAGLGRARQPRRFPRRAARRHAATYRSFTRTPAMTVVKTDPFAAHVELLDRLTDKAMHDLVAYLETLK